MGQENDQVKQQSDQYMHDLMERLKQRRDEYRAARQREMEGNKGSEAKGPDAKQPEQQRSEEMLRAMMRALREERCA